MKDRRGFTLLETLLYIALLSFLMGEAMICAFYIVDASEKNKADISVQTEANFLLRKIDWALTGIAAINSPVGSATSTALSINKINFSQNPLRIDLDAGHVRLARGASPPIALTNDAVTIENLAFLPTQAAIGTPPGVTAIFAIQGQYFSITKYARQ